MLGTVAGMELRQVQNSIVQAMIHASTIPLGSELVGSELGQVVVSTVVV
jgi:hypothetical protein